MPTNVTGLPQVVAGPTVGVEAASPPNITQHKIAPTTTDYYNFNTGDLWLQSVPTNTTPVAGTLRAWMLAAKNANGQGQKTATWIPFFNGAAGSLVSLTGNTGGAVFGDANQNVNTVGDGVGITVTGVPGTHTLTWSLVGGGQAIQSLQPAINGVANGAAVTPTAGVIQINNTDANIIPVAGVPNPNNLNLNFANTVYVTNGVAAGLTAPTNQFTPNVMDSGFVNVYSTSVGFLQILNFAPGSAYTSAGVIGISKQHGTLSAKTAINTGDVIGTIAFSGYDGTNYVYGASIQSTSSGTIAANRVAANLVFSTHPDSASGLTATPRVIITPTGRTQVGVNLEAGETVALEAVTGDITIDAGNLNLPLTTTLGTQGVLTINANPTIHQYTNGGSGNIYVGAFAGNLHNTNVGSQNSAFGVNSLLSVTSGSNNLALGTGSLNALTTSPSNCAVGWGTLPRLTTAATGVGLNTAVGTGAGEFLLTGEYNLLLGYSSGFMYTGAESSNILVNHAGVTGESNVIRIGTQGSGLDEQNKCWIAGIRGVTTDHADAIAVLIDSTGQLGTVSSSERYKENIDDLSDDSEIIYDLRPVKFNYKKHPQVPAWGLIAEEVDGVFPQLVVYDDEGLPETIKYHDLVPLMLNEIQKLNARIKELESKL